MPKTSDKIPRSAKRREMGHKVIWIPVVWATREIVRLCIRPRVCAPIPLLVMVVIQGGAMRTFGILTSIVRTLLCRGACVTITGFMVGGLVAPICIPSPQLWQSPGILIRWVQYNVIILCMVDAFIFTCVVIERLLPWCTVHQQTLEILVETVETVDIVDIIVI